MIFGYKFTNYANCFGGFMKSSHFQVFVLAGLLSVSFGCGKDSKNSSASPAASPAVVNLYNAGITQTSQQILDKNISWYNSSVEGYPGEVVANRYIKKTEKVYSTVPNCQVRTFLGISFQTCLSSSSPTSNQVLSLVNVFFTPTSAPINTKGNSELNSLFAGAAGTLMSASDISSNVSSLEFVSADGLTVTTYYIDRGLHSKVNPVVKEVLTQQSKVVIETFFY